jgi:ABC-2 type transport system permease protein
MTADRHTNLSATRIRAVVRKEMRDYRRNRFIATTMAIMPILFMVAPIAVVFGLPADVPAGQLNSGIGLALLYLTLIPALVPAVVSSYAVVGEREQGTLEPVLTTPLRREELLLGKALAAGLPTLAISYLMYGIFLACAGLFAHPNVSADIFESGRITAQILFTPLLATWSIWAGIAISTRASDVRVAQQLGTLVSLPPLAITALMNFGVITRSLAIALILGAALLAVDLAAWKLISRLFDRERLITGTKA